MHINVLPFNEADICIQQVAVDKFKVTNRYAAETK